MKKLVFAVVVLTAPISFAQTDAPKRPTPPTQHIEFGGDEVEGTREAPDLDVVHGRTGVQFKPLIKVRENFQERLMGSVQEL